MLHVTPKPSWENTPRLGRRHRRPSATQYRSVATSGTAWAAARAPARTATPEEVPDGQSSKSSHRRQILGELAALDSLPDADKDRSNRPRHKDAREQSPD